MFRRLGQGIALAALLAGAGCSAPPVEGYQLQGTPEGFIYVSSREWGQGIVPGLTVAGEGMWVGDISLDEPRTFLSLIRYRGAATRADAEGVRATRAQFLASFSSSNVLGPFRDVPLDEGGVAWAWTEERVDESGRLRSLLVSAVIAFDTVSFALELDTDVPERMSQAHLDAILTTFALGRTRVHFGPIVAVLLAVAGVALFLGRRMGRHQATGYRLWEKEEPPMSPPPTPDTAPPTRDPP